MVRDVIINYQVSICLAFRKVIQFRLLHCYENKHDRRKCIPEETYSRKVYSRKKRIQKERNFPTFSEKMKMNKWNLTSNAIDRNNHRNSRTDIKVSLGSG